jgi:hypothetical protein
VRVGCRERRAPEIRVKAMEGAEDLDVQALKDSPAYGARTFRQWRRKLEEALSSPVSYGFVTGAARPDIP